MLTPLTLWTQLTAIKKQLVETWDKLNNFISTSPPRDPPIIFCPLVYKYYKHSRHMKYVTNEW